MFDVYPIDLANFDEYYVNSSRSRSLRLGLSSSAGSSAASASGWEAELTSPVWAAASSSAPPLSPPCVPVRVPPAPEEPTANMSVEERLAHEMGPQRLPLGVALPLSSIYAALIVLGVLGNVLSLYIIVANRAMRTAANLFLCSLAVSDTLLLLCGAPEELLHAWYQYPWTLGEAYCAVKAVGLELGNDASVLTILLFSLARYFKICHSMWNIPLLESGSVRWTAARLTLIWGISLLFSLPFWPYMQVTHYLYTTEHVLEERLHSNANSTAESVECANASEWVSRQTPIEESLVCLPINEVFYQGSINHLMMVTSMLFFVVPMVLLVFIYSGIMCVIKKRRRELRSVTRSDRRSLTSSSTNAAQTNLTQLHVDNGATEPRRLSEQIFGIKPSSQLIALRMLPPKAKKGPGTGSSPAHKSPRRPLSQAPASTAIRMQTLPGCSGSDRYGSASRLNNEKHVNAMSPTCSRVGTTPLTRRATALTHAASCSPRRTQQPQNSAPNTPDASKAARQPDAFARRVSFMEEEKEAPGTASSEATVGGTTRCIGNGSNNAHPNAHSSPNANKTNSGAQNTNVSNALRIPAACAERRANSVSLSAANSSNCLCPGGAQSPGVVRRATLDPIAPGAAAVLRRESMRSRSGSVDVGVSAAAYARRNRNRNSVGTLLVSVVVAFFICYIPFHTQRILSTFNLLQLDPQGGVQYLFYISGLIYYMSAFVNPVVYSLASRRFRQELLRLVCQRRLRVEKLKWAAEATSTHAAAGNCNVNSVRVMCATAGGPTLLQQSPSPNVAVAVHSPTSSPTRSPSVSPAHEAVALPDNDKDNTESATGAETPKTTTTITTTTTTNSKPSATESVPASNASPTAASRKPTLKAAAPSPSCFLIGTANPSARRTERPSPLVAFESSTRRITERRSLDEYPESPPPIVNRRSLTSILEMPAHTGNSERSGSPPAPNWICAPHQSNASSVTPLIGPNPNRGHQSSSADYSHSSAHTSTRTLVGENHLQRVTTQTVVFATSSND